MAQAQSHIGDAAMALGPLARLWRRIFPLPPVPLNVLHAHQRRVLRGQVSTLLLTTFLGSTLVGFVFWSAAPARHVAIWVALVWACCAFGAWREHRRRKDASPRPPSPRFVRRSIVTNLVPGLIWGAAVILLFVPHRFDLQVFLVFILAGMSAGMVAALPSTPAAALAFIVPSTLPMCIEMIGRGNETSTVIGIMIAVYVAALLLMLRNGYRCFCDGVVAEERAKQAEEVLRDSIEAFDDGYVLFGADDRVLLHNRSSLKHFNYFGMGQVVVGRSFEELVRSGIKAGFYAEDDILTADPDEGIAKRLAEFSGVGKVQVERRLADGRRLLISTHAMPDGRKVAVISDITALKRAEQRLFAAIEAMDDGFILYGPDEQVLLHNRRYLQLYPHLRETLPIIGQNRVDLLEQAARAGAFRDIAERGGPEGWVKAQLDNVYDKVATEFERETSDGRIYLVRTQITGEGGRVAITTDVTALKRAQKRLVDAVESMSEAFVLWDAEDRLVLCNDAYARMFDGVPRSVETGATFEDILRAGVDAGAFTDAEGREQEFIRSRLAQHRNPGEPVIQAYQGGRWLRLAERRTSEGGIVGLRSDVTETIQREQVLRDNQRELAERVRELEEMQKQLQAQRDGQRTLMLQVLQARDEAAAANAAKSVFLANMSHELRTPLNAIIGFAEIMNGELFGGLGHPRYSGYVGDMLSAARHLLKLINDILDLSKIEAGKWELHEEPVDIGRTLDSVMRMFRAREESQHLKIAVDAPEALPPILADERALKQILINAMSNSIKFTPPGGRVRLRARRDGVGRLHIAIGDTGIGIKPDEISKALAPFGQVDNHMTRRHHGTGLGLPIAKALVEHHGGRLRLRSRPGYGTVIAIMLPAERFAAAQTGLFVAAE